LELDAPADAVAAAEAEARADAVGDADAFWVADGVHAATTTRGSAMVETRNLFM
jgi:hypothetical protein